MVFIGLLVMPFAGPPAYSLVKFALNIIDHQKIKKEEKGYEKDNLFGWHWFVFSFGGISELCPGKNSHY